VRFKRLVEGVPGLGTRSAVSHRLDGYMSASKTGENLCWFF